MTRPTWSGRIDDQVVQLSELLHLVVVHAEPPRASHEVADAVSAAYGRTLTVEGVEHLIATRLEPLGLVVADEAEEPMKPARARPLLALTLKAHARPRTAYARPRDSGRPAVLAADRPRRARRARHRGRPAGDRRRVLARGLAGVRDAHDGAA